MLRRPSRTAYDRGGVRWHTPVREDQDWRHSQKMLQYELEHLSNHFTRSVIVQESECTAHDLVNTGYEWIFVRSGLLERMSQTAERVRAPSQTQFHNFQFLTVARSNSRSLIGRRAHRY